MLEREKIENKLSSDKLSDKAKIVLKEQIKKINQQIKESERKKKGAKNLPAPPPKQK